MDGTSKPRVRRLLRRAGLGLLGLSGAAILLVVLVLTVLLHSERSATRVARLVLGRVEPYAGARIEVDRLRIQRTGRIDVRGARLVDRSGAAALRLEALAVQLRFADLAHGRIVVDSLRISGPAFDLARFIAGLPPPSVPAPAPAPGSPAKLPDVSVGYFILERGQVDLARSNADAPLRVRDLTVQASGIRTTPNLVAGLDSLGAALLPPGSLEPARLWARGSIAAGIARLDTLQIDGAGTHLAARASAPVLAGVDSMLVNHSIDLEARPFDAAILRPFVAVPENGGEISLQLQSRLHGTRITDARGSIDLVASAARWGDTRFVAARFDLDCTDAGATFALRIDDPALPITMNGALIPSHTPSPFTLVATHPAGQVHMAGDVTLQNGQALRITDGRVTGLDLARVTAGLPSTNLAADFQLEGRVGDAGALQLASTIDVAPGSIGTVALNELHLEADIALDTLRVNVDARANGARMVAAGRMSPLTASGAGTLRLEFSSIDLGKFFGASAPHTNFSGLLEADFATMESTARRALCTLRISPSQCGQETIEHAVLQAVLVGTDVDVDADVALSAGSIELDVFAQPFGAERIVELRSLRFAGVDAGALIDRPSLRTQLHGTATGRARQAADALDWNARLEMTPSTIATLQLESVTLAAQQSGDVLDATADVQVPAGACSLVATGTLGESMSARARGSVHITDLSRALGRGPAGAIELGFEADGADLASVFRHATATLVGRAELDSIRIDSLDARVEIDGDLIHLADLGMRSNVATLTGAGTLTLPDLLPPAGDSLAVRGVTLDMAPVAALLGREVKLRNGSFAAVLHAAGSSAPLVATLALDSLQIAGAALNSLDVSARAAMLPGLKVDNLLARIAADTLHAGRLAMRNARADVALDSASVRVHAHSIIDDSTQVGLALHGTPSFPGTGTLDSLDVTLGDDRWALVGPVEFATGRRTHIDAFHLASGSQAVRVQGTFDADSSHALEVAIDSLRLEPFTARLGYPEYGGMLDAAAQLTGRASAPLLDGEAAVRLVVDKQALDLGGTFRSSAAGVEFAAFLAAGADSIHAQARMPVALPRPLGTSDPRALADAPFTAAVRTEQFGIAPLAMLAPNAGILKLDGVLDIDARADGTLAKPRFEGEARLDRGVAQLAALGALWENIVLRVGLANERVQLEQLSVNTGKGSLGATGSLSFATAGLRDLELHAQLDRFRTPWNRSMQIETSGSLDVTGTPSAPQVHGRLSIGQSSIEVSNLTAAGADVQLTNADLRMLEENFGYHAQEPKKKGPSPLDAAAIELEVTLGHDTWIRRRSMPRLTIGTRGVLKILKQPHEALHIDGEVNTVSGRSYVEEFGRRFAIETGKVTFEGDPRNGRVDLVAKHEVRTDRNSSDPDVVIRLAVKGDFAKPHLTLTSQPSMEQNDIVTTLVTGRPPPGTVASAGSSSGTGVGTAMVAAQATGAVEDLGADIGLDVLQIEIDGVRGATVIAGRYANERTYLGVRQSATLEENEGDTNTSGASTEVEVEYEFLDWLLFNLQGGVTDIRAMLRSRYEY